MNISTLIQRFFLPGIVKTLYFSLKYNSKVSPKAEVDISPHLQLGEGSVISSFTKIKATDGPLKIGKRSSVEFGCFIAAGEAGVEIGENCLIGPNVSIIGNSYNYDKKGINLEDLGKTSKGVKIGANTWIGAGTAILDGAQIGDNSIIVANSLINRKYKNDVILQGAPAKVILSR
ncbi:MAG: acyltransferase [Pseudomonadales bacterium]